MLFCLRRLILMVFALGSVAFVSPQLVAQAATKHIEITGSQRLRINYDTYFTWPGGSGQSAVLVCTGDLDIYRPDGVLGDSFLTEYFRGGCERGATADFGGIVGGNPWDHSRRLGVKQPLFSARRLASLRAISELRSRALARLTDSRNGRGFPEHGRHRQGAAGSRHLVRL